MKSWAERYIQAAPVEERPTVERVKVEGATCPSCGSDDVRRYPVATQHGARVATKCQGCLHILAVERPLPEDEWPPFRSTTFDWEPSAVETRRD
jgi:hypothetical protein